MHVLFVNQYFYPDSSATAQIVSDLAVELVRDGLQVTVICCNTSRTGKDKYPRQESYQGVQILRVPSVSWDAETFYSRFSEYVIFLAMGAWRVASQRNVDMVVTLSTPPLVSLLGLVNRFISGAKFVYWVQDVYPDIAVNLGVLNKRSLTTRLLEWGALEITKRADVIVTIGECMKRRLKNKGLRDEQVAVVHNWSDGGTVQPIPHKENFFRTKHDLQGKFVVLYSGNLGRGHRFDWLLEVARSLQSAPSIRFVFVGTGTRRQEVERFSSMCNNICLLPHQPYSQLRYSLGAADLAVITLRDNMLGLMVPSKLYGHLASGRPILFIGPKDSTVAAIIEQYQCGAVFSNEDVSGIQKFIRKLVDDPGLAARLGKQSRKAYDDKFNRSESTDAFQSILSNLVQPST